MNPSETIQRNELIRKARDMENQLRANGATEADIQAAIAGGVADAAALFDAADQLAEILHGLPKKQCLEILIGYMRVQRRQRDTEKMTEAREALRP